RYSRSTHRVHLICCAGCPERGTDPPSCCRPATTRPCDENRTKGHSGRARDRPPRSNGWLGGKALKGPEQYLHPLPNSMATAKCHLKYTVNCNVKGPSSFQLIPPGAACKL